MFSRAASGSQATTAKWLRPSGQKAGGERGGEGKRERAGGKRVSGWKPAGKERVRLRENKEQWQRKRKKGRRKDGGAGGKTLEGVEEVDEGAEGGDDEGQAEGQRADPPTGSRLQDDQALDQEEAAEEGAV